MALLAPRALVTLTLALPACSEPKDTSAGDPGTTGGTTGDATTGTTDDPTTGTTTGAPSGPMPHRGECELVVSALPFPLDGPGKIGTLTIGRREYNENFANRGDIEVSFDHDDATISVEVCRYTFGDAADAADTFARLSLWAFAGAANPGDPTAQDPASDCTRDTWKDDCAIYLYYDGQSQPARSGADFRVHLPRGWRGRLNVTTEDNAEEQSYPLRGDITIDGLCSDGEVKLEAGRAEVRMCRELTPAPTCLPEDIATCETWPDGSGDQAWSPECPCPPELFGQLRVEAPQPWAANIVVDIPPTVWLGATLQNTSPMKPHDCKPQFTDCDPGACVLDASDAYAVTAEFNHPSDAAPAGAGFTVTAVSGGCTQIPFVDDPADWSEGQEPPAELRGFIELCTDCL